MILSQNHKENFASFPVFGTRQAAFANEATIPKLYARQHSIDAPRKLALICP
jgi:hypothetical protein